MFRSPHGARRSRTLLLFAAVLMMMSCGGGDDEGGTMQPPVPQAVSGQVTKGAVEAASVTLHAILASGEAGEVVGGPWTTDGLGQWAGEIPAGSSGPYVIIAQGGSYTDEASGAVVSLASEQLIGYSAAGSGQVTPYTHALGLAAMERMESDGASASAAWSAAVSSFEAAFGFDPTTTEPSLTGPADARTYLALLGGISELLDNNPALTGLSGAAAFDLVLAIAADLSDGRLDGITAFGEPIDVETGSGTSAWPSLDPTGIGALIDAVNDYASRTEGLEDIDLDPVDLDFDDPVDGNGSGSLTLTGPGASLLQRNEFTPLGFSSNESAVAWATAAPGYSASLGVSYSLQDRSTASLVIFTAVVGQNSYGWQIIDFSEFARSVGGVSIDGTTVTFTNVVLPGTTGTDLPLTLNGQVGP